MAVSTPSGAGAIANETWHAKEELAAYGVQPDWFGLGDRDLGHPPGAQSDAAGGLSAVAGHRGAVRALGSPAPGCCPASDDRSETHVVVTDPGTDGERRAIHFQEWWVRYRAQIPTHGFAFVGCGARRPRDPGVAEAIADADVVFLAPSNPVVSVGAILAVPGIRGALRSTSAPVIGYSPIVAGKALRGMADECLSVIGVRDHAREAVGAHFGARSGVGILDGWLIDEGGRRGDRRRRGARGTPADDRPEGHRRDGARRVELADGSRGSAQR